MRRSVRPGTPRYLALRRGRRPPATRGRSDVTGRRVPVAPPARRVRGRGAVVPSSAVVPVAGRGRRRRGRRRDGGVGRDRRRVGSVVVVPDRSRVGSRGRRSRRRSLSRRPRSSRGAAATAFGSGTRIVVSALRGVAGARGEEARRALRRRHEAHLRRERDDPLACPTAREIDSRSAALRCSSALLCSTARPMPAFSLSSDSCIVTIPTSSVPSSTIQMRPPIRRSSRRWSGSARSQASARGAERRVGGAARGPRDRARARGT